MEHRDVFYTGRRRCQPAARVGLDVPGTHLSLLAHSIRLGLNCCRSPAGGGEIARAAKVSRQPAEVFGEMEQQFFRIARYTVHELRIAAGRDVTPLKAGLELSS